MYTNIFYIIFYMFIKKIVVLWLTRSSKFQFHRTVDVKLRFSLFQVDFSIMVTWLLFYWVSLY